MRRMSNVSEKGNEHKLLITGLLTLLHCISRLKHFNDFYATDGLRYYVSHKDWNEVY